MPTHRRLLAATAATSVIGLSAVAAAAAGPTMTSNPWPYGRTSNRSAVLAAVGDIACEPDNPENAKTPAALKCGSPTLGGMPAQFAVADQVEAMKPQLAAILGDEQYEVGKLSDFEQSYDKTFGAFKFLQRPAPGNHEYYPYTKHGDNEAGQNGAGYFAYFNGTDATGAIRPEGQAGEYNKGWYSYDLAGWHIISLNAECNSPAFGNSCDATKGVLAQETAWLAKDLAANRSGCTLAYWHQPTFTSDGSKGTNPAFASDEGAAADAWWKLLYAHRADLVLAGHEHVYARFKPMNPAGAVDPKRGLTQFIIGTGGEDLDTLSDPATLKAEHVVTGQDQAFGAMKFTLTPKGYSFTYRPVMAGPGQSNASLAYSDSGSGTCHQARSTRGHDD